MKLIHKIKLFLNTYSYIPYSITTLKGGMNVSVIINLSSFIQINQTSKQPMKEYICFHIFDIISGIYSTLFVVDIWITGKVVVYFG